MIEPKPLTASIAVTGDVRVADVPAIAERYNTLVNNRPDAEELGQPTSAEIEYAARLLELDYVHIPIVPGQIDAAQVAAFADALADKPGPTLAFCRTGTRSASLWALSQAGSRDPSQILSIAASAGYDLKSLEPRLREAAQAK